MGSFFIVFMLLNIFLILNVFNIFFLLLLLYCWGELGIAKY